MNERKNILFYCQFIFKIEGKIISYFIIYNQKIKSIFAHELGKS